MAESFDADQVSNRRSPPLWLPVAVASGVASFFAVLLVGALGVWFLNSPPAEEEPTAAAPLPLEIERPDKAARLARLNEIRSRHARLAPPPAPTPGTGVDPETPPAVVPAPETSTEESEEGGVAPPLDELAQSTEADTGRGSSVTVRVPGPHGLEDSNRSVPTGSPPPRPGMLIWSYRSRGIFAAAKDGIDVTAVVDNAVGADGVAVCESKRTLFWALAGSSTGNRSGADKIQCVSEGDDEVRDILDGLSRVGDLVLDEAEGRIYWSNMGRRTIQRADWDGSNVEDFITGINEPDELALDTVHGYLYWSECMRGAICRAKTTLPRPETLIEGLPRPVFGIALDVPRRHMYFVLWSAGRIMRSGLDGSAPKVVVAGLNRPDGVAVDLEEDKLYWTENGLIGRANLDGSGKETIVEGKTVQYASVKLVKGPAQWLRRGW
jgi:sugar lactone lactonase YvrE